MLWERLRTNSWAAFVACLLLFGSDCHHIKPAFGIIRVFPPPNTQTSPLPDRKINDSIMMTQHITIQIHNIPQRSTTG